MRAFLLVTSIALLVPLAAACSEDDAPASGAAGGAAGQASGGAGGEGLTAQITPTSDAACPKIPPASGEGCARADDAGACVYDGTDCQRFDAVCRKSVWTVLVVRETTCIERPCPTTVPADGEACEESSIPNTNDCRFNEPQCGDSRRAICNGGKWSVSVAEDTTGCQLTCPDAPPKVGGGCKGYAPNGCEYENSCSQTYSAQCSNGKWVPQQGRDTCTTSVCPEILPTAASSCLAFEPNLGCGYKTTCGQERVARCNIDTWVVNNPCGD